jgi:hypothetical protein
MLEALEATVRRMAVLIEGAGIAWITIDGALSLNDMTSKAREALSLLREL